MHSCEVCSAKVSELRRGRCWGCYARWVDARPVGIGARCVTCTEKRRRFLKSVELYAHWQPMCFNCAGQLLHIVPLPATMAELKIAVSRERRKNDRRFGKTDSRVFQYERRVGERRAHRAEYPTVDDDMIIEVSMEDDESMTAGSEGFEDLTQIRELVSSLDPDRDFSTPPVSSVEQPLELSSPLVIAGDDETGPVLVVG
ncbi:MAG: hypothetical protein H0V17_04580 [Deltaproteobacteria bacterium]|nr:hypothetical protein [Deltaproteobacteria bacterium]